MVEVSTIHARPSRGKKKRRENGEKGEGGELIAGVTSIVRVCASNSGGERALKWRCLIGHDTHRTGSLRFYS